MTQRQDLTELTGLLLSDAHAFHHRRTIVISGGQNWCRQTVQMMITGHALQNLLWVGEQAPAPAAGIHGRQAQTVLGQEYTAVVFDAHCGFDPDAFGAVTGTIKGGGLLFLLTPSLAQWPDFSDPEYARITVYPYRIEDISGRFLHRLSRIIQTDTETITLIRQHHPLPVRTTMAGLQKTLQADAYRTGSDDQERAVAAIMKVARGHRRRPLVITAHRGRGKSSAFGIAAARLLQGDCRHILVTGPHFAAVQPVFEHARRLLSQVQLAGPVLRYDKKTLEFAAPDELLHTAKSADLLLVDEAAAISTALLEQLLGRYARIAFATTTHGYEGSGRGFSLRFSKILDQRTPGWKALSMEAPIRWAGGDPLERFTFRALLLDAGAADEADIAKAKPEDCIIEALDRDRLSNDETTLSQLFGLLVTSHYRTRPYDLRHLLDGPNLQIHVMRYRQNIVATALVAIEGHLEAAITDAVYQGYRRLQGHLIPQTLMAQLGIPEVADMSGARIMRIAVHPVLQRRGFGSCLLDAVSERIRQEQHDWIGASFGATPDLVRFWASAGQLPLRLGFRREASSGAHSLLVLRPLSERAVLLCRSARQRFLQTLPDLLNDPLSELDPPFAALLLLDKMNTVLHVMPESGEWSEIEAFAFHQRHYEDSLAVLRKLTIIALRTPASAALLSQQEKTVLIGKVLQNRSWPVVAGLADLTGRKQVITVLRQSLRTLYSHFHTAPHTAPTAPHTAPPSAG